MSRVLVTGGAGFIGSFVVDRLRAAGHEAVIFDVRRSPHHGRGEVPTVIGDVLDLRALRKAARGCDAVAHLAAAADVGEVASDPQAAEELNSRGTFNVLEAARAEGVPRVIYASTVWVYSEASGNVDEDVALLPPAHLYTATKLAGELYCRSYSELYGVETTILRFGIPYGPRARPAAVVPAFVQKALRGEALSIAGTGEQTRRFVYVEDLAEGVVRALAPVAANRTYNLVGSEDVSIRQIADTVRTLVGEVEIEHTPGRAGDFNGGADISGARAVRELGWHPDTEFRDGVARYVAWHERYEAPPTPATARMRERLATSRVAVALDRAWERMGLALMVLALLIGVVLHTLTASTTDAVKDLPHHRTTLILIVVAIVSGAAAARARRSDRARQTDTAG